MKALWITTLCLLAAFAACQNMTGKFVSDWQNQGNGYCAPDFFTITQTGNNTYNATYNYSVSAACLTGWYPNTSYSANISQYPNGTWIDTQGQQLIYDQTHDVFYFIVKNDSSQSPALYDRTGSYISLEVALDNIGGTWINPTPLNSSSGGCCVPDSVFVTIANQHDGVTDGDTYITPNFSTTTCARTLPPILYIAYISTPSTDNLTWSGFGSNGMNLSNYILNPSNASQITVMLDENNSCWYTYDKQSNTNSLINGTWHLDWQSANALYVPQTYVISIVNGSFMEGTLVSKFGNSSSYIVGNGQTQYSDSSLELTFSYNVSTNTLISINDYYSQVLYSPNGSLIPNYLADTYWDEPEALASDDDLDECCVPRYISVNSTGVPNVMNVAYIFSSDFASNSACDNIAAFVNNQNELESTLNITAPSTHSVTWTDENYSAQISFLTAPSEIMVSNFSGTGCSFKMAVTTTPPSPLSGNWLSIEIKALFMLCLLVLFCSM